MGSYEYSLPIEVPPGRAGMSPRLSLEYASTGPDGLLGVGWSLGGLSAIHPCDYSIATDDVAASDDTKGLCLDGNRIIAGHTESDIVARIDEPSKTVQLKDGRTRTYGSVGPEDYWVLLFERDLDGNSITYEYEHFAGKLGGTDDADATEILLRKISYTGRVSKGETGSRWVSFDYEARPDPIYVEHSLVNPQGLVGTTQLLNKITMYAPTPTGTGIAIAPASEVWHYDLSYAPSFTSGRSLLRSVTQTGALGSEKLAKVFSWGSTLGGDYDSIKPKFPDVDPSQGAHDYNNTSFPDFDPSQGVIALDVDNDGREEMLVETAPGTILLYSTPPGKPAAGPMLSQATFLGGLFNATLTDANIGDLDGDGVPEIVAPDRNYDASGYKYYRVYKWSQVQHDYVVAATNPVKTPYLTPENTEQPIYLADMDGDGLPELLQASHVTLSPFPDLTCVGASTPSRPRCLAYSWSYQHNDGGTFGAAITFLESHNDVPSYDNWGNETYKIVDYPPMSGSPFSSFQLPERGNRANVFASLQYPAASGPLYFPGTVPDAELKGFRLAPGASAPDPFAYVKVKAMCALGDFRGRGGPDFECFVPSDVGLGGGPGQWTVLNFDVDADGRDDLVAYTHLINPFRVDNGFYVHYDVGGKRTISPLTKVPIIGGDFNGDGRRDIYGYDIPNNRTFIGASLPTSDLIEGVSEGSITTDVVAYTQQWSAVPVTAKACTHPQRCIRHGMTVVKSHAVEGGAGWVETDYNYDDPRYDVHGRGFLGFGTVREWTPARPSETITTYDNETSQKGVYLAFLPKEIRKYVPVDLALQGKDTEPVTVRASLTSFEYAIDFNGKSFLRHPRSWMSAEWEPPATLDWSQDIAEHFGGFSPSPVLRQRLGGYSYDAYGNKTSADAHTLNGDLIVTTTVFENRISKTDWLIGLPQKVVTSESGPLGAANNRMVEYVHDPFGHLQKALYEQGDADPEIPETLTYEYNADGLQVTTTATAPGELPRHTYTEYDPDEGIFQRKVWNDLGHTTQTLVHPVFGAASNTLDPNGVSSEVIFDDFGRVRRTARDGGPTVDIDLNALTDVSGNIIGSSISTHGNGVVSTYAEFDAVGHNVLAQHTGFDGTPIQQASTYDLLGRLIFQSRPGPGKPSADGTWYVYDSMDRKFLTQLADGSTIQERTTFFEHHTVDGEKNERYEVLDIEGRVSSSVQVVPGSKSLTTTFSYGDFHQLLTTTDPLKHVTTISYDKRGRRKQIVDLDTGTATFHYNGFGDLTSVENPSVTNALKPALTSYIRDGLGRMSQVDTVDGTTTSTTKFTWDTGLNGLGLPATTESPDHTLRGFDYDAAGRLWKEKWVVNGEAFDTITTYQPDGSVASLTYPNVPGRSSRFQVARASTPTGYEATATEIDLASPRTFWTVNARDMDDHLVDGTFGNGLADHRTYYPLTGQLHTIQDGPTCGPGCLTPLYSLEYQYYKDGQLYARTDSHRSRAEVFAYDPVHRLQSWGLTNAGTTRNTSYTYDEIGNLKTVSLNNAVTETNVYECAGGVCAGPHALMSTTIGTNTSTFGYDARGRQTSTPARKVTFNERNLPSSISPSTTTDAEFLYDAAGARVRKTDATGETISIGGIYERRKSGNQIQHVFYVPGTDGALTQVSYDQTTKVDTVEYIHRDKQGTVGAVSDKLGAVTWHDHEPFGASIKADGSPLTTPAGDVNIGYTGHMADDALGLVNMRGRIYDPAQRHFISPDPFVPRALNTQSYNRYSYVENDPINFTDPSGFRPDDGYSIGVSLDAFAVWLGPALSFAFTRKLIPLPSTGVAPVAPTAPKFQTPVLPAPGAPGDYVGSAPPSFVPFYHFGTPGDETEKASAPGDFTFVPPPSRPFAPGRQPVPFYIGTDAHEQIAVRYVAEHPNQLVFTNYTPLVTIASKLDGRPDLLGVHAFLRPDILNTVTNEIYEIKPAGSEFIGRIQLLIYTGALARAGIPTTPGLGGPGTKGVLSAPGGYYQYWSPEPGLISYQWLTPRMRLYGIDPVYWAVGAGLGLAVGAAVVGPVVMGAGAVESAPETAIGIDLLNPLGAF